MSSAEDFFALVEMYNVTYWPVHVVTFLLGITAVILALKKGAYSDRIVSAILASLWLWSGIVFFMIYFSDLTPTLFGFAPPGFSYASGALFIIQSIIFLYFGVIRDSIAYGFEGDLYAKVGLVAIVYAMIVYPIIGYITGHPLPGYPLFGSAPCPVAIFTVGMLLLTNRRMPPLVPIIPLIWGLMGIVAVVVFTVWADVGLFAAGIVAFLILKRNAQLPVSTVARAP
ncbi:MAG: hypothetical protein JSV86_01500 [Gemmatimonadota bacterium]|nr:MAG: hypothetical protein JSV86_01500 [Gemmatimonadota bacterium]